MAAIDQDDDPKPLKPDMRITRLLKAMVRQSGVDKVLRGLGFSTITELVEAHRGKTYFELSKTAGVVPAVLCDGHAVEAVEQGSVRRFVMEALVRELRHFLADTGWIHVKGQPIALESIHAMVVIDGALLKANASQIDVSSAGRAWATLMALDPPIGWLPADVDDPLIQAAFNAAWPDESRKGTGI